MSETPPDPADVHTGTDRVELTKDERAQRLLTGIRERDDDAAALRFINGWMQALTAERDKRLSAAVRLEQRARAERDAARAELERESQHHSETLDRLDAAVAELASANARCAELEAERSNPKHGVALDNGPRGGIVCLCGEVCNPQMGRSPARIMGSKSDTYVAVNAGTVFAQHLREANANLAEVADLQATLDRVTALADEWDVQATTAREDAGLALNVASDELRAALDDQRRQR